MSTRDLFFDAEEYWRDKEYKCWVVCLSKGDGKRRCTSFFNIQARTPERAIHVAKLHSLMKGKVYGTARLATPHDLGAKA